MKPHRVVVPREAHQSGRTQRLGVKLLCPLFLFLVSSLGFAQNAETQLSPKMSCILKGVWQRDDSIVGSGLGQNFQFNEDSTFVLNLGTISDDARMLIQLKGRYRLESDNLFFTILSRVVLDGGIELSETCCNLSLFNIAGYGEKEYKEVDPKEMKDPCSIQFISCKQMKLNNEIYFKVE